MDNLDEMERYADACYKDKIREILEQFASNEGATDTWEHWLEIHVKEILTANKQEDETFCFTCGDTANHKPKDCPERRQD